MEKRHAIIVLKNSNGDYLQYYDDNWKSYLFLNCKVNDKDDISKVEDEIFKVLGLRCCDIVYKFDKIHIKFSIKDKINKEYHHYFYLVNVCDINLDSIKSGVKLKWYSYDELLNDSRIQMVNSDIVQFIKDI